MSQRRKPAKRAFTGLVGMPQDEPVTAVVEPTPAVAQAPIPALEPASKKRGPKPKGDNAMTAAERKQKSRFVGSEREGLVKRIKKRIKTSEHANISMMRRALAAIEAQLETATLEETRALAKTFRVIHDTKGRTSLEGHTGTAKKTDGEFVPRIENIDAKEQMAAKIGGGKHKMGPSPNVDEDHDGDSADASQKSRKVYGPADWVSRSRAEAQADQEMAEVTERMFDGEEVEHDAEFDPAGVRHRKTLRCRVGSIYGYGQCQLCRFKTATWFEARKHIDEELARGQKQWERCEQIRAVVKETPGYDITLHDEVKAYRDNGHHERILWTLQAIREEHKTGIS